MSFAHLSGLSARTPIYPFNTNHLEWYSVYFVNCFIENKNALKPKHSHLAKHIDGQRKKIGGDFVVSHVITSRSSRENIRSILPDCIFILLSVSKETQQKRVAARHGSETGDGVTKLLFAMHDLFEPPGSDETNTFKVDIDENMTPKEVMEKVVNLLAQMS